MVGSLLLGLCKIGNENCYIMKEIQLACGMEGINVIKTLETW